MDLRSIMDAQVSLAVSLATVSATLLQDEALLKKQAIELENIIHKLCNVRDALKSKKVPSHLKGFQQMRTLPYLHLHNVGILDAGPKRGPSRYTADPRKT